MLPMGGRKIYLFATRGSFVSLPLVPPSSPRRCTGYRGAPRCRGGLRAQRLRGTLAAHPAEPGDRVPAGGRSPRLCAPRASGAGGEPRGSRCYAPHRPANEIGPCRLRPPMGSTGRGAEPRGGARCAVRRPPAPPPSPRAGSAPRGRGSSPAGAVCGSGQIPVPAEGAVMRTFRGGSPRYRTGGTARPGRGQRQVRWAPGGRGIPGRRDGRGGAWRPAGPTRPARPCSALSCPTLPCGPAPSGRPLSAPASVRSAPSPLPGLRFVPRTPRPGQCPRKQILWWAQRAGNNTALGC